MIELETEDGLSLEARWDVPDGATRALVLCHAHPLMQGTMASPLLAGVTRHLTAAGVAVLRFNFRGAGHSTGRHDDGIGELHDVSAAMTAATAAYPNLPVGLAGWSFGAATALNWQAATGSSHAFCAIAVPLDTGRAPHLPGALRLVETRRTFVIGDRDQFVTVDDTRAYADSIGGETVVINGSDHFFSFREDRVAAVVAATI